MYYLPYGDGQGVCSPHASTVDPLGGAVLDIAANPPPLYPGSAASASGVLPPREDLTEWLGAIVERDGQHFNIERCDLQELTIRLNDNLCDLNKRITVSYQGHQIFKGKVSRSSELIQRTTLERGDYTSIFSAEINLAIPSK